MKQSRVKFTVRRLLAVVALVAVVFGSFEAGVRWERDRAESRRRLEEFLRSLPPPDWETGPTVLIAPVPRQEPPP